MNGWFVLELIEAAAKELYLGVYPLLVLMIIFFLLAVLVKGKGVIEAAQKAFPNSVFNLSLMSLNIIFISPVIIFFSQLIQAFNIELLGGVWGGLPPALVIVIAVFFGDFIGYWRHRFEHCVLLWPSHATHHSDTQMSWLTLQRFHPINRLSTFFIDSTFLLILGLPPYAVLANNLVRHYYGYFIHADLPWSFGVWGKIFVSPVMHRWHHALPSEAHNTNYATVFAIFDRLFGTYRVPSICDAPLGVLSHQDKGLLQQLIYPFKLSSYRRKNKE